VQSKGAFVLRMNFWSAPSSHIAHHEREKALLSYETPHDHNFSLLTIGCHGPGYKTRICQYSREKTIGYLGEKVSFSQREDYQLGKNDILFYESCKDVHEQLIPEELSVSLNLIAQEPQRYRSPQFFFDFRDDTISGYPESRIGKYMHLLNFLAPVADTYRYELSEVAQKCEEELLRDKASSLVESTQVRS